MIGLEDCAPLLLEPRDRIVAADRLEALDRLPMGAVRLGVRLVIVRRARFQFRKLGGERPRVGPLEDRPRSLERARDIGGDDRRLVALDLSLERVAAAAVFELGGDLGERRDAEERRHRRSLSCVDVNRFGDRLEPCLRLLDRAGLLGAAARVLARAGDALLDRVGALTDTAAGVVETERGGDCVKLVGEQRLVALHLGDAVLEFGAGVHASAQFVERLQRLLDRAKRGLFFALAKPRPRAGLTPGRPPIRVRFLCVSELGLGASGLGAALLRLLPQRREFHLVDQSRLGRFDQRVKAAACRRARRLRRAERRSAACACARPPPRRGAQRPPTAAARR